jgi:hypothetical protein
VSSGAWSAQGEQAYTPGHGKWHKPQRITHRLTKFTHVLLAPAFLSLLPLAAGSPPIPHRTPKILLISLSALSSLSTGMTSLQLELLNNNGTDDPTRPKHTTNARETQLTRMWLRIACSVSLGLLAVGYTLWFLRARGWYKKRAFLIGFWGCSLFCWLFVNPGFAGTLPEGKEGDGFGWLDGVNLFGLIAVVVGILNAESSLFVGLFASGDGQEEGEGGRRRIDDGESQHVRRVRRGDEEEAQGPGEGRLGGRDGDATGVASGTGLGVLSLANTVFGA